MSNRGGSRPGAGRKRGSGFSNKIKKHVENMLKELLSDEEIKAHIIKEQSKSFLFDGWVYVIKNKSNGLHKIGVTQQLNPKTRLALYNAHDMKIKVIFIDKVDMCYELEQDLIDVVKSKRVKGDWFDISDDDLLIIAKKIFIHKNSKFYI